MIRALLAAAALCAAGALLLLPARPAGGTPLWPGARFTTADRDRAIQRGMVFAYTLARDPRHFEMWGHDLVGMFGNIAATARDPGLRRMAWAMGRERAREWRRLHPSVPRDADSLDVCILIGGSDAAERLGIRDPRLWRELREAAARFTAVEVWGFDPVVEAPPSDLPEQCPKCYRRNARGVRRCARCGGALEFRSRYDVWQDALIDSFTADRYGVTLGAHFVDVIHWLPQMRPYLPRASNPDFYDTVYAVTHVVYTLNEYTLYQLSPACLPQEFAFLVESLPQAIAGNDPETMGEFLDALRSFGLGYAHPAVRAGTEWLLECQNPDGSWDDPAWPDIYGRYHPTWTVIDGLRDYRWLGARPCIAP